MRYRLKASPLSVYNCHCKDCQRFSGAGWSMSMIVRNEDFSSEGATVRLCKGAYLEPPTVAFPAKAEVDRHFIELMHAYLAAPPPAYLQIASHDEKIIVAAEARARQLELPRARFEFQMLYGIRTARQEALAAEGYQVRVYVPFGTTWYPYFMRRLAERPANLFFFIRGMFQR